MLRKLILAIGLCSLWATAQEPAPKSSPPPPAPAKAKAKKVYTEEDLGKLRGGISVVGEPTKPKEVAPAIQMDDLEEADLPGEKSDRPQAPPGKRAATPSNCKSAAWAKIVDLLVSAQGLQMAEGFWHQKLFGHAYCSDNVGSLEKITGAIEGDYVTDAGARLRATVKRGRPLPDPEELMPAHQQGERLVVVWKGQPYYADQIDAVEQVAKGRYGMQRHMAWIIKRFRLVDPDSGNIAFFESGKDKMVDINGSFFIIVARR